MTRRAYPKDLSDEDHTFPMVLPAKPSGRPHTTNLREGFNAIFSLLPTEPYSTLAYPCYGAFQMLWPLSSKNVSSELPSGPSANMARIFPAGS